MNVLRYKDKDFDQKIDQLTGASSLFDPAVEKSARSIIGAVKRHGDSALREFTAKFDGAHLREDQLAVTKSEMMTASLKADKKLRDAIALADKNVASFAKKSQPQKLVGKKCSRRGGRGKV